MATKTWQRTLNNDSAERADAFITRLMKSDGYEAATRSQVQRWIQKGYAKLDGQVFKAKDHLRKGQRITVEIPATPAADLTPVKMTVDILHEDEHLIVVNKPPGISVHPSPSDRDPTLVQGLLHITQLSKGGEEFRPGVVHRLDKFTSGAILFSKTDVCHAKLNEMMARREISRKYWAICYGIPRNTGENRVETLIGRNPADRKKMSTEIKTGKPAITFYRLKESFKGQGRTEAFASLIEARLETGRTHQVRVHLTGEGVSLVGDPVYGRPSSKQPKWLALPERIRRLAQELPGQALHAVELRLTHPMTGKKIEIAAPPPREFTALLSALRALA